jgi:hypothetical protein
MHRSASPPPTVQVASAPEATLAPMAAPATTVPSTMAVPAASPLAAVLTPSVTSLVTPPPDSVHASRPAKGFGIATRPPTTPPAVAARAAAAPPAVTVPPAVSVLPAATAPPTTVAAEPGQLQIAVRPWGEVSVDGRVIGTTPLDHITLPAGSHVVRVRHPLYEVWERPVSVRSGETAKMVVDLPTQGVRKQP